MALTAKQKAALSDDDFAVPGKRKLPIHDKTHVTAAWHMLMRTQGLTDDEVFEARRRILARAKRFGIDTSGWKKAPKVSKESHEDLPVTGQSIMRDLTHSLENLGIKDLAIAEPLETAEPIEEMTLESLDELNATSGALQETSGILDELCDSHFSLEAIAMAIEGTLANGGLNAQSAAFAELAIRNETARLGISRPIIALESFDEGDPVSATRVSLESVGEILEKIWHTIVGVIKAVGKALANFFEALFNWFFSSEKKAERLSESVSKDPHRTLKVRVQRGSSSPSTTSPSKRSESTAKRTSDGIELSWDKIRYLTINGKVADESMMEKMSNAAEWPAVFFFEGVHEDDLAKDAKESEESLIGKYNRYLTQRIGKLKSLKFVVAGGHTGESVGRTSVKKAVILTTPLLAGDIRFRIAMVGELEKEISKAEAIRLVGNGPDFSVENESSKHQVSELNFEGTWVLKGLRTAKEATAMAKEMKKQSEAGIKELEEVLAKAKSQMVGNDKFDQRLVGVYLKSQAHVVQQMSKSSHAVLTHLVKVMHAVVHVGEMYVKAGKHPQAA